MRRLVVSRQALRDLDAILRYSETTFGPVASERYAALIDLALHDVRAEPDGSLMKKIPGLPETFRLYHIRYSVKRSRAGERVKDPSHCVAYRFDDQTVTITNLLHERMDIPSRLK